MKTQSVLVVEDDENIRSLYATALEAAGLIVHVAENGAVGVKKALEHQPDVILMDIMMPGINGHEAVEKIRLDSWGKDAKVVFLTNMSDAENVVKAVEAGSDEYIVKVHATPKEVVNKVRTVAQL